MSKRRTLIMFGALVFVVAPALAVAISAPVWAESSIEGTWRNEIETRTIQVSATGPDTYTGTVVEDTPAEDVVGGTTAYTFKAGTEKWRNIQRDPSTGSYVGQELWVDDTGQTWNDASFELQGDVLVVRSALMEGQDPAQWASENWTRVSSPAGTASEDPDADKAASVKPNPGEEEGPAAGAKENSAPAEPAATRPQRLSWYSKPGPLGVPLGVVASVAALAGAAAAFAALRPTVSSTVMDHDRARRERLWVRQHVKVEPKTGDADTAVQEAGGCSYGVRLQPHPDAGIRAVEEIVE